LSVPLEAITTEKKHSYVWVKDGASYRKQEVKVGAVNDMAAMVYSGLKTEETVFLTVPSDTSGSELIRTDTTIKPPVPFIDKKEQELLQNHLKTSATATKRGAGEISGGMTIVIE